MPPAPIVVIVAARGIAAVVADRRKPAAPVPQPVVEINTVDGLVANYDTGAGSALSGQDLRQDLRWQRRPAAVASAHIVRRRLADAEQAPGKIANPENEHARIPDCHA